MSFFACCGPSPGSPSTVNGIEPELLKELGTRVADSKELPEGGRLNSKVEERFVTVLRLKGQLSCIDSVCYHAGGPLGLGDIEELEEGKLCIVCPWHGYKIDVITGEKYYQDLAFEDHKPILKGWKSDGRKHRIHTVTEAEGGIFVKLADCTTDVLESDDKAYNTDNGNKVLYGVVLVKKRLLSK